MMRIKWIGSAFACMALVFACGGGDGVDGSGVDPDVLLAELEPDESDAICEYQADLVGPPRTIECADGEDVEVDFDVAECADSLDAIGDEAPDCTVTVGEFEACIEDLAAFSDDQSCDPEQELPASCDILLDPDC